jgi:hypothetical protein
MLESELSDRIKWENPTTTGSAETEALEDSAQQLRANDCLV